MFHTFNYSSIVSIVQCNGPFNHFSGVVCVARYILGTSIGWLDSDRVRRAGHQNLPLEIGIGQSKGDFERIGKRADERIGQAGRALDGPRKLSRVCRAGIVSGNRADRAALP